jgi:uncharacterized membrane protein
MKNITKRQYIMGSIMGVLLAMPFVLVVADYNNMSNKSLLLFSSILITGFILVYFILKSIGDIDN